MEVKETKLLDDPGWGTDGVVGSHRLCESNYLKERGAPVEESSSLLLVQSGTLDRRLTYYRMYGGGVGVLNEEPLHLGDMFIHCFLS